MSVTRIVALDPGKITGVAYGQFSNESPLALIKVEAVPYNWLDQEWWSDIYAHHDIFVSESFTLRDNAFMADLTPVKIEGMMDLMLDGMVNYRQPALKTQVPDTVLKEHGLWQTGKDVDWEDGRDANDAIIHLLGHVAFTLKHLPTLREYFK